MLNLFKIFKKSTKEVQDFRLPNDLYKVCSEIGLFYLKKHNGSYEKAAAEIEKLRVTNVTLEEEEVHIECVRVGIFIGRRGENIKNLEDFLERKIVLSETKVDWTYLLTPTDYYDEFF